MNKKLISTCILLSLAITALQMGSCKKKKKEEGELITTIKLTLNKGGIPSGTFIWKDLDGDGGNAPSTLDTIKIDSGILYNATLTLFNESNGKNEDISAEINAEASSHLICYTSTPVGIKVDPTDSDGKYPIGLLSEIKSTIKGDAKLRVVLRHQPGVKNGTCDPGETDVDIVFPVKIK